MNHDEKLKEQEHLEETYNRLLNIINNLEDQKRMPDYLDLRNACDNEERQQLMELQFEHRLAASIHYNQLKIYKEIQDEVYFARIDILNENNHEIHYISKIGLTALDTDDWRSQIGSLIYDDTSIGYCNYRVILKRKFNIFKDKLKEYTDIYKILNINKKLDGKTIISDQFLNGILATASVKKINDPYFISILQERKLKNDIGNIIESIQATQNQVIRLPFENNLIVLGCAGSGKTMVLFHRLSYLKYNYKKLNDDKIVIITPNNSFEQRFKNLQIELELENIRMMTIYEYYINCLLEYDYKFKDVEIISEYNIPKDLLKYIYSKDCQDSLLNEYKKQLLDFKNEYKKLLNYDINYNNNILDFYNLILNDNNIKNLINESLLIYNKKYNKIKRFIKSEVKKNLIDERIFVDLKRNYNLIFENKSNKNKIKQMNDIMLYYHHINDLIKNDKIIDCIDYIDTIRKESYLLKETNISVKKEYEIKKQHLLNQYNENKDKINNICLQINNEKDNLKKNENEINLNKQEFDNLSNIHFIKKKYIKQKIEKLEILNNRINDNVNKLIKTLSSYQSNFKSIKKTMNENNLNNTNEELYTQQFISIVVITDRNDLDNQLFGQFLKCKDFLRQTPIQAESRVNLHDLLDGRKANGIIFSTMQKFEEESEPLSERRNI